MKKIQAGDTEELVGLSLLYTAYHSRNMDGLLLASGKLLEKTDCPKDCLELYTNIIALKDKIGQALPDKSMNKGLFTKQESLKDAEIVNKWIRFTKNGDMPQNASDAELVHALSVKEHVDNLKTIAMLSLPKPSAEVAKSLSR